MKLITLFLCFFIASKAYSQKVDTVFFVFKGHEFFYLEANQNSKLIIFLHGGVNNPIWNNSFFSPSIDFILESNTSFVNSCIQNGFNVLLPIKDDSLNWISNNRFCTNIFDSLMLHKNIKHNSLYISGFSDGGTASYKMFYDNPDKYDGLMVFNGFPQHKNWNKDVEYYKIQNKKILFVSTYADNIIPYEFLLTEYSDQKQYNACTYIYLAVGKHSFGAYTKIDFKNLFDVINGKNKNLSIEPIHGFMKNDVLVEFYPFRKKILRRYSYGKNIYDMNLMQKKSIGKKG